MSQINEVEIMKNVVGIRREDKNIWERRAPLIPLHVKELIQKHSLEVWVQSSKIRVFPDEAYSREGAIIKEDMSSCPIIFAVKEIPLHFFKKETVYIFFSHTIKGQPYNMAMLKRMMDLKCTLIDYERIVNEQGLRILFFGRQAGQAGMVETLWALGQRLDYEGKQNPFATLKQAYKYRNLFSAKDEIAEIGRHINKYGFDSSLVPLVCGFAGYGNVSQGAQEIFDILPSEIIEPGEIEKFFKDRNYSSNKIYKVIFQEEHMVETISFEEKFELQDYYNNPQRYKSIFESYIPFLTILVNCIYWTPQFPRFVTKKFLKQLWSSSCPPRLRVIGDISCDVEGSIECTVKSTSPDKPVFLYNTIEEKIIDGVKGSGVVVMAIDNLPAEISIESSEFFSHSLEPFVPDIAKADFSEDFENCDLPPAIKKAVIIYRGKLTPNYEYMKKFVK